MDLEDAAPRVARVAAQSPVDSPDRAATWLAIYNPTAGRSRRSRAWSRIERELRRAGLRFDVAATTAAGEGADIAAAALRAGIRRVMVAGGDGTVHEVVNGLMRDAAPGEPGDPPTVVPLPLGTGNDWARTLRLPHDPQALAACVARNRGMLHDVGRITFPERPGSTHWFINVAGAGFDAHVIATLPMQTPSALAYLSSALRELRRYRSPQFRLECDGAPAAAQRLLLAFVANARYCGHGMHVAPEACLDDGRLDLVTVGEVGLVRALPKVLKLYRGTILSDPLIEHRTVATVRIDAEPAAAIEADGQLVGRTPAIFSVQRQALRVLVGT